jgi:SOS response regulatory protein OraA/RecX
LSVRVRSSGLDAKETASDADAMETAPQKTLLNRAGKLLGRRSFSRAEMRARLAKFGSAEEVETTLERLEALHLLNDAEYAYNLALRRVRRDGWGPLKVHQALIKSRIDPRLAEEALARVRQEVGEQPQLEGYLEKYRRRFGLPSDRKAVRKLILHLRARGFQDEIIYGTLRRVMPDALRGLDTGD